jgi:hypothetical protein
MNKFQEVLLKTFSYDPETGQLTRLKTGEAYKPNRKDGYVVVGFDYKTYLAHRLIWIMVYGRSPTEIDHIDGNPSNNALSNLREVTHYDNLMNSSFHRAEKKAKRRRPLGWRRPRSMHYLWP